MIKDYKSFLKLQYVSRNEDLSHTKFEVKNIAWINFGIGEELDDEGYLQLVHHPDSAFVRFSMDSKQPLLTVSYQKKNKRRTCVQNCLPFYSRNWDQFEKM